MSVACGRRWSRRAGFDGSHDPGERVLPGPGGKHPAFAAKEFQEVSEAAAPGGRRDKGDALNRATEKQTVAGPPIASGGRA